MIYGLLKTKQTVSLSQKLVILLSISDFFVGFLVTPAITVVQTTTTLDTSCEFEEFAQFIGHIFTHFSAMLVSTIALDRYFHIRSLTTPNKGAKRSFILGLVVFDFVLVISATVGKHIASKYRIGIYHSLTVLPLEMLYIFIGIASYLMAMKDVRRYVKEISSLSAGVMENFPRRDIEMAKTVVLILVTVVICFTPSIIVYAIYDYVVNITHRKPPAVLHNLVPWFVLLMFLNSGFNSIILISRNSELKSMALRFLLICRNHGQNDSGTLSVKDATTINGTFQKETGIVSLDIKHGTTRTSSQLL